MYLAFVMDLYFRPIKGREVSKRMTTGLIEKALLRATNLRKPLRGVVFHADRGSRYTS
jgi:putative transposase